MLPCIAVLAVYCVSVIFIEVADALDGVRLFVNGLGYPMRIGGRDRCGRVKASWDRSRTLRCNLEWLFCHNLAGAFGWLLEWKGRGKFTDSLA